VRSRIGKRGSAKNIFLAAFAPFVYSSGMTGKWLGATAVLPYSAEVAEEFQIK
jgi:hypothetical protein